MMVVKTHQGQDTSLVTCVFYSASAGFLDVLVCWKTHRSECIRICLPCCLQGQWDGYRLPAYGFAGYILPDPGENCLWAGILCLGTSTCVLAVNFAGQHTFFWKGLVTLTVSIHRRSGVEFNFAVGILDQNGCKGSSTLTKTFHFRSNWERGWGLCTLFIAPFLEVASVNGIILTSCGLLVLYSAFFFKEQQALSSDND